MALLLPGTHGAIRSRGPRRGCPCVVMVAATVCAGRCCPASTSWRRVVQLKMLWSAVLWLVCAAHISPCLPMSPHVSPYLPISPHVSPYLPMSPHVSPCLPMSPHVSPGSSARPAAAPSARPRASPYSPKILPTSPHIPTLPTSPHIAHSPHISRYLPRRTRLHGAELAALVHELIQVRVRGRGRVRG